MLTEAFATADEPVLLRAEGPAFCAGLDLDHLWAMMQKSYEQNLEDARRLGTMYYRIWNYPLPVVAAVQGPALAGGCGLVSVCDYADAAPEARFGYTEVTLGWLPAIVSIFLETGRELLKSGRIIDATQAQTIGLVNEVVPAKQLDARARELLAKAKKRPRRPIAPSELEQACIANAQSRMTPECRAGVKAFLDKRSARRTSDTRTITSD